MFFGYLRFWLYAKKRNIIRNERATYNINLITINQKKLRWKHDQRDLYRERENVSQYAV